MAEARTPVIFQTPVNTIEPFVTVVERRTQPKIGMELEYPLHDRTLLSIGFYWFLSGTSLTLRHICSVCLLDILRI